MFDVVNMLLPYLLAHHDDDRLSPLKSATLTFADHVVKSDVHLTHNQKQALLKWFIVLMKKFIKIIL